MIKILVEAPYSFSLPSGGAELYRDGTIGIQVNDEAGEHCILEIMALLSDRQYEPYTDLSRNIEENEMNTEYTIDSLSDIFDIDATADDIKIVSAMYEIEPHIVSFLFNLDINTDFKMEYLEEIKESLAWTVENIINSSNLITEVSGYLDDFDMEYSFDLELDFDAVGAFRSYIV